MTGLRAERERDGLLAPLTSDLIRGPDVWAADQRQTGEVGRVGREGDYLNDERRSPTSRIP